MKTRFLLLLLAMFTAVSLEAGTDGRYIEVTGTSEMEVVPDKIH